MYGTLAALTGNAYPIALALVKPGMPLTVYANAQSVTIGMASLLRVKLT